MLDRRLSWRARSGTPFVKEIVMIVFANLLCVAASIMILWSLNSTRWVIIQSKKLPFPGMPWVVVFLGLQGGVVQMTNEFIGKPIETPFIYDDSDKYCPNDTCHALRSAGIWCTIVYSMAIVAAFVTFLVASLVALQLGKVIFERGPLGPYIDYSRCWRNCIAACTSAVMAVIFSIMAVLLWALLIKESSPKPSNMKPTFMPFGDIPVFGIKAAEYKLGWIWTLNIIVPICFCCSAVLLGILTNSARAPSTRYLSIK